MPTPEENRQLSNIRKEYEKLLDERNQFHEQAKYYRDRRNALNQKFEEQNKSSHKIYTNIERCAEGIKRNPDDQVVANQLREKLTRLHQELGDNRENLRIIKQEYERYHDRFLEMKQKADDAHARLEPVRERWNALVKKLGERNGSTGKPGGNPENARLLSPESDLSKLAENLILKGLVLSCSGQFEESLHCYTKSLKISPLKANTWFRKGFALYRVKRYEEALRSYSKALQLDPTMEHVWNYKGFALTKLGRFDEAVQCFEKALVLCSIFEQAKKFKIKVSDLYIPYNDEKKLYSKFHDFLERHSLFRDAKKWAAPKGHSSNIHILKRDTIGWIKRYLNVGRDSVTKFILQGAIPVLILLLEDEDNVREDEESSRESALEFLRIFAKGGEISSLCDAGVLPFLVDALNDDSPGLRWESLECIKTIIKEKTGLVCLQKELGIAKVLQLSLKDKTLQIRWKSVEVLQSIKHRELLSATENEYIEKLLQNVRVPDSQDKHIRCKKCVLCAERLHPIGDRDVTLLVCRLFSVLVGELKSKLFIGRHNEVLNAYGCPHCTEAPSRSRRDRGEGDSDYHDALWIRSEGQRRLLMTPEELAKETISSYYRGL